MTIETINPAILYDGTPIGMSQATVDTHSGLVFISGQVDWDAESRLKSESVEEQTRGAIDNLSRALVAAESSIEHILQLRVFVRGELGDHMERIVPIIAASFGQSRPALTGVGVASLATPDTLIEIEAVAKLSSLVQ